MTYLFRPPTVREGPLFTNHRLGYFFALTRGVSVLKNHDGTYSSGRFFSQDEAAAAAFYYQGGHDYVVDAAEKAALEAAGFTVLTT